MNIRAKQIAATDDPNETDDAVFRGPAPRPTSFSAGRSSTPAISQVSHHVAENAHRRSGALRSIPDSMMSMPNPTHDFDAIYAADKPPAWDIGRPQPAFNQVAKSGGLAGRILDAGCGTGEHALMAASLGYEAVGVDMSVRAIETARTKAAERGVETRFLVADALRLVELGEQFETVLDSWFLPCSR